jgi:hypothetical protein
MSSRSRNARIAALLIAPLLILPSAAQADHSWGNYHWARTDNSFKLLLGGNVSQTWRDYLSEASAQWSISSVLQTEVVPGGTKPRTCKATAGRVEVCSERYGFNGWLGIAQIWVSSGHITAGITKVNDSYFNSAKYNTPGWRMLVMCQEIGHTFGLDHQNENFSDRNLGTCMDYTSNPDGGHEWPFYDANTDAEPANWYPNHHDYEQLEAIYGHLDTITTVGTQTSTSGKVPPPFATVQPDEPRVGTAQWGRLIRSTNGGRTETFELDQGGGRKVYTHVIWADPEDQPGQGKGRR